MADIVNTSTRSRIMSSIRSADTQPEMALRRLLHAAGLRYGLHRKNLPGKPDIVLTRWKAVVLVHGCFWHRHSGCHWCTTPATNSEFWNAKFAKNVQRDQQCVHELLGLGWRVATVWECALRGEDAPRSADLIQDWLRSDHQQFETGIIRPQCSFSA